MDRTTEGRIQEIRLYILQMQSYDKSGNTDKKYKGTQEVNGMTKRIPLRVGPTHSDKYHRVYLQNETNIIPNG